jgi:hypothetical protein
VSLRKRWQQTLDQVGYHTECARQAIAMQRGRDDFAAHSVDCDYNRRTRRTYFSHCARDR